MRKLVFTGFIFLLPLMLMGQVNGLSIDKVNLLKNEIKTYNERKDTDSSEDFDSWRYYRIGKCYEELGEHEKAIAYYRLSLLTGDFDFMMIKRRNFGTLASYFLRQRQYDSIFYYYDIVERCRPKQPGCGTGKFELFTNYRYWLMAALDGKGMTDSAIKVFLPFAFQEWTNNEGTEISTEHLFDDDYHCKMVHFLEILQKKYCYEDLRHDIIGFTNPANFYAKKIVEGKYCTYRMYFTLRLGDHRHDLYGWDENCADFDANRKEKIEFFLESILWNVKNSFIYKYFLEVMPVKHLSQL